MSGFEALPIISVGMSTLTGSYSLYKQLSDHGIIFNKAATINWNDSTIQQEWHLRRLSSDDKKSKISNVFKKKKILKISNILPNSLECIIFPQGNKDPQALGIISTESDMLTINLTKLNELLTSEMLVIRFTSQLDKRLYAGMCKQYHNRTPVIKNSSYEISFSVILDRADLWKSEFRSLSFTNILRTFEIHLDEEMIEQSFSPSLKQKIRKNANLAVRKYSGPLQFFNMFNTTLLSLNGANNHKLFSAIRLESSVGSIDLKDIHCGFNNYDFGEGYTVSLPTTLFAQVACSMNGGDQALSGKFVFNPSTYKKIISNLLETI